MRYYLLGMDEAVLARVSGHQYEFLDQSGQWVASAYVTDCVTGYKGGHAVEISESDAVAFVRKRWRLSESEALSLIVLQEVG
jgi:hypothetical protein